MTCFFLLEQLLGAAKHRSCVCVVVVSIINLLINKKIGVKHGPKTCRIYFQNMKEEKWQPSAVMVVTKLKRTKEELYQMQVIFRNR